MNDIVNTQPTEVEYEAPCVESVLTVEDIEREVHYAGVNVSKTIG